MQAHCRDRVGAADKPTIGRCCSGDVQPGGPGLLDDPRGLHERLSRHVIRQPTAEQFVHHHAERIDIGAGIDGCAVLHELLGGHVGPRADELPRLGSWPVVIGSGTIHPRDSEIDDLRPHSGIDKDIARLEIAMHDALRMAVGHRLAHLQQELDPAAQRHAAALAGMHQRFRTGNKLHHVVRHVDDAQTMTAGREDLGDARMTEPSERVGLTAEPQLRGDTGRQRAHHLHRDGASRVRLQCLVDAAHAPFANQSLDANAPQVDADQRIGAGPETVGRQTKIGRPLRESVTRSVGVGGWRRRGRALARRHGGRAMQSVVRLRRLGTGHDRHTLRLQMVGQMAIWEAFASLSYGRSCSLPEGLPSARTSPPGLTFHGRGRSDSMTVRSIAGQESLPCRVMPQ